MLLIAQPRHQVVDTTVIMCSKVRSGACT